MSQQDLIVYGANGYTGKLILKYLTKRGLPFTAAGRNMERLEQALAEFPGNQGKAVQVEHDERKLSDLFKDARCVINCTGPFGQLGTPVLRAALDNNCHYLDPTGETDWMWTMKKEFGPAAEKQKLLISSACSYMWTIGSLAAELCIEEGGIDTVDILYDPSSAVTIASSLSFMRMVCRVNTYLENNEVKAWEKFASPERKAPRTGKMTPTLPWSGGAEAIWFSDDPRIKTCRTLVVAPSAPVLLNFARQFDEAEQAGKSDAELEELTNGFAMTFARTPPPEIPDVHTTMLYIEARGPGVLRKRMMHGTMAYDSTGFLLAEAADRCLTGRIERYGYQSAPRAFGTHALVDAMKEVNLLDYPVDASDF